MRLVIVNPPPYSAIRRLESEVITPLPYSARVFPDCSYYSKVLRETLQVPQDSAVFRAVFLNHAGGSAFEWVRKAADEGGGFAAAHVRRVVAEIMLGGGFDPVDSFSHFGYVEIHFHNPLLAPYQFDEHGPPCFGGLAQPCAGAQGEDIFRRLLRDGAASADFLAVLDMLLKHILDFVPVEPIVGVKVAVFSEDCGVGHIGRYFLYWSPFLLGAEFRIASELDGAFEHQRCVIHRHILQNQHSSETEEHESDGDAEKDYAEKLFHETYAYRKGNAE